MTDSRIQFVREMKKNMPEDPAAMRAYLDACAAELTPEQRRAIGFDEPACPARSRSLPEGWAVIEGGRSDD